MRAVLIIVLVVAAVFGSVAFSPVQPDPAPQVSDVQLPTL